MPVHAGRDPRSKVKNAQEISVDVVGDEYIACTASGEWAN